MILKSLAFLILILPRLINFLCFFPRQAHAICYKQLNPECNFGLVQSIMLPPYCVSIPRTDVPLETIIGVQNRKKGDNVARKFSKCCPHCCTFCPIVPAALIVT